ncbi:type II secretion system F family protein [Nocardioides sp.]|uniref:type II secretion system F family protein n=1 Tax=Nocardioides sp. TaxID=35761 RepID=UPI002735E15D|nr:type II secretion system F family protein [Nocardioides sp.]MDP3894001.1 type II secretion system F family protein [Nocardioides sp.]
MRVPGVGALAGETGPVLPAVCAGVAVWLLFARTWTPARRRAPRGWALVAVPVAGLALVMLLEGRLLALGLVLLGGVTGGQRLWRQRRERLAVEARRAAVTEMCDVLAAELASGQPPGAALDRAARDWPELRPVARAHALGADVPTVWRLLAVSPGGGDLRLVAAAWQVTQASGSGLADAIARVAALTRATQSTRRLVASELASARSTARLMAGLPVLALAMGSGIGGNPWAFLFLSVPGLVCLAVGLAFGLAGLWWIESIAASVTEGAG